MVTLRQPFGVSAEINHNANDGARLMGQTDNANAAHFDQSGKRLSWAHQQTPSGPRQMHSIISDESGKRQQPRTGSLDKGKRET